MFVHINIIGICCDSDFIYILYENSENRKSILKLKEKENKDKFEIFYSKNLYETALLYAENSGFEKKKKYQTLPKNMLSMNIPKETSKNQ